MTHLHQRETEKVKTEPLFRYGGTFIISSEPDTPDPILRRSLDEHPVAGTEQELAQVTMLAEFRQIPGDDQLKTPLRPDLLAESAHLPAQCLRCSRMWCLEYARGRFSISEQQGLCCHHEMFR